MCAGEFHLHELFCFSEGRGRHRRPDSGSGAEGRRRARRELRGVLRVFRHMILCVAARGDGRTEDR
jgi:hypothetical protein